MSAVEFVVRGTATERHPAQIGTVDAAVEASGPDPAPVAEQVRAALREVRASVDGAATRWTSRGLRTWVEQRWSPEGEPIAPVHHASAAFEVHLEGVEEVGAWIGAWIGARLGRGDGLVVHGVRWELDALTGDELLARARAGAVHDALAAARAYAEALGLGPVRPVAVADVGLLGAGGGPSPLAEQAMFRMAAAPGGGEVLLEPGEVEVVAQVEARFRSE